MIMLSEEEKAVIRNNIFNLVTKIRLQCPEIEDNCKLVGFWVWAEFKEAPSIAVRKFLHESGFKWNGKRNCWQNCCGLKRRYNPHANPKEYYANTEMKALVK